MAVLLLLILVVALPALIALSFENGRLRFGRHRFLRRLRAGAPIVYCVHESSTCPTRDARDVHPAEHGDFYYYTINKYWRVEKVLQDGSIVACSPLMEHHYLRPDDPNLRKASLVERLRYGARFPYLT